MSMMKPSLQVRLSQHLALTPQLQQSIRLLQLSTLELQQEISQLLEQNPFLEVDDEAIAYEVAPAERAASGEGGDAAGERDSLDSGDGEGDTAVAEVSGDEFDATARDDWENGTEGDDFEGIRETPGLSSSGAADDDGSGVEHGDASLSLQQHLRSQMAGMRLSAEDRVALEVLIDSLDGDGYLSDTLDDIAARLVEMLDIADTERREELMARLQCALAWLHSMDPTGVGARSLSECLTLQLRTMPHRPEQALALVLAASPRHLELLARRDFKRLAAITDSSEERVREAQALIVQCEPKPGRAFDSAETYVVVPDVIVRRVGRTLKVMLNPDVMPKLRINDLYARALRAARGTPDANAGMGAKLQEARWFMKNIQQRFDTILRVSSVIVERQKSFFSHGAIAMKPLVLREIAEELELHESTISRVTTAKYLASPMGTFELKYFFGSSLNTESGGNASSTAVRALIRQFVAAESPIKPLSDSQLSQMLDEQGIQVARRTVAKYREALKIAPASQRKSA